MDSSGAVCPLDTECLLLDPLVTCSLPLDPLGPCRLPLGQHFKFGGEGVAVIKITLYLDDHYAGKRVIFVEICLSSSESKPILNLILNDKLCIHPMLIMVPFYRHMLVNLWIPSNIGFETTSSPSIIFLVLLIFGYMTTLRKRRERLV